MFFLYPACSSRPKIQKKNRSVLNINNIIHLFLKNAININWNATNKHISSPLICICFIVWSCFFSIHWSTNKLDICKLAADSAHVRVPLDNSVCTLQYFQCSFSSLYHTSFYFFIFHIRQITTDNGNRVIVLRCCTRLSIPSHELWLCEVNKYEDSTRQGATWD